MVTVDWGTRVITVPQSFLSFIGGVLYELDVNAFRLALKDLEDDADGMAYPDTHQHNTEFVLSGVTYARSFEIINGFTVTFEDVGPHYTVRCIGANHNIADVLNFNAVNLIVSNSAGLVTVVDVAVQDKLNLVEKILRNRTVTDPNTGQLTIYDDDSTTPLLSAGIFQDVAGTMQYDGVSGGIERKDRLA